MPRRMAQDRQDKEQSGKQRKGREDDRERHKHAPSEHCNRALQDRLHADDHRRNNVDFTFEQQRNGEYRDREKNEGQNGADNMAGRQEDQPLIGCEYDPDKFLKRRK